MKTDMKDLHFTTLHYTEEEDWYVCVEHIASIRHNHDKKDPTDNGVWIYFVGDSTPIKVTEPIDEVIRLLCEASIDR